MQFPVQSLGFSFDNLLYIVAVALEHVWVKKAGEENNIKSNVKIGGF